MIRSQAGPELARVRSGGNGATVSISDEPAAEERDEALIAAILAGDADALGRLYDRYSHLAVAVAYRVLGERGAAEDAVQDAFLAAWRRADSFDPGRGAVRGWLLAIVRNAAVDRRRGRYARILGETPIDAVAFKLRTGDEETLAVVTASIEAERVRDALAALPAEQRQAIELAYFGGLSHQEIAERTGAPLGTIKGRLRLGLHKLRANLVDLLPVDPAEPPSAPHVAGDDDAPSLPTKQHRPSRASVGGEEVPRQHQAPRLIAAPALLSVAC